jgi:MFS family permease
MATKQTEFSKHTVSLWRNRDYILLWGGQGISTLGSAISRLTFPLLILAFTGSPAQAGFVGALNALPYLILSLPAGALIDRWDRKRVMLLCDAGRAVNMASIPVMIALGHLTLVQLYCNSLIEGSFFVFFNLAEVACLPRVVSQEQLPAATGQNEAITNVATLLGPLLGGFFFSLYRLLPFLLDAISYVVSVLSLFFIKTTFQEKRVVKHRKLWVEIGEGLRWLWQHRLIRMMAFLTGSINFGMAGIVLILIILAQRLHTSTTFIGLVITIGGVGGILGSLLGAPIQRRFSFGKVIIGVIWVQALLSPLFVVAPNAILLGIIAAAFFTVIPIYNVTQFSYRLSLIPDELQGRVNSVFRLVAFGFQPLGLSVTGILIQQVGAIQTVLVLAALFLLLAIATTLNVDIRRASAVPHA